jgi:hypothetical protein
MRVGALTAASPTTYTLHNRRIGKLPESIAACNRFGTCMRHARFPGNVLSLQTCVRCSSQLLHCKHTTCTSRLASPIPGRSNVGPVGPAHHRKTDKVNPASAQACSATRHVGSCTGSCPTSVQCPTARPNRPQSGAAVIGADKRTLARRVGGSGSINRPTSPIEAWAGRQWEGGR